MHRLLLTAVALLFAGVNLHAQSGCTDQSACNYDPNAITDDGSCAFVVDCAGVCGGTFVGDLCGNCYDPNGVSEPGSLQFDFTGGVQSFTVPENVTEITVEAFGAQGGSNGAAVGGLGGSATATIPVTPLEVLNVYVGGAGTSAFGVIPDGGFNGGGGIYSTSGRAGTGGGASDVRRGTGFNDRLIVAGGGGGHGYLEQGRNGGDGGGLTGGEGDPANDNPAWISGGGTQNAGGFAPTYGDVEPGSFGQGGDGDGDGAGGGGGGGGYYGGGGGQFSGGGGGSSFVDAPGNTNTQTTSGVNTGDGYVIISWAGLTIPECNEGCMNPLACNYDDTAEVDDGSCILPDGCTDPTACNYDDTAQCDDGSCVLPDGCTDDTACNYDPNAICDDGSCAFVIDCAGVCGGTFVGDLCGNCYDPNGVSEPGSLQFDFTGGVQSFTVPENVTEITVEAFGAQGGSNGAAVGGLGGSATATIPVTPLEVLNVYVGGAGTSAFGVIPDGGFNGGGGIYSTSGRAGTGGGASDVRRGTGFNDRLIVAGGGGGHGYLEQGRNGGDGGGLTGGEGDPANDNPAWISGGGTQNAGGFAPTYGDVEPGSFGQGGDGDGDGAGGGGGGGGYYGGGGGQFSGGGGGSSFVDAPGNTNTQTTSGVNAGDGYVIISWSGLTIPECNEGCMNPLACNYDDTAEVDDGSCILPDGCTDPTACNYDDTAQCDDGSCVLPDGCTDDTACNYDPNAICDDGSCAFVIDCAGVCGGTFVGDLCGNCYDPNGVSEPGSQQFDFTGGVQSFTVPENVTEITVEAYGAQGGGNGAAQGGLGGSATATIPVTPLEVLNVYVGGAGTSAFGVIPDGGFNGGGGIYSTSGRAGTGGGASDVRRGTGFSDRLIVAGGGGGHGYLEQGRNGGDGGGLTGGEGDPANDNPAWISGGGTQNAGGFAPTYGDVEPGSFGQGGDGDGDGAGGGGGGGGYYGGGGGQFSGGGGGSSFVDAPGNTNTQTTSGVNAGNGYVIISWAGLTIPECNEGCMNPLACNYDDTAEVDDGSCILPDGCTDPTACNYDDTAQCDDGSCVLPDGCTDDTACNYDPNAICDDGSCAFVIDCAGVCGGTFVGDLCGNCYDPNGISEPGSQQFDFTGGVQSFTVPENVTEITVEAYGAQGGGNGAAQGGLGGSATATIPVTPLEVLNVYVGGAGTSAFGVIPDGGFNGGGGIYSTSGRAGTGGGASDVRRGTGFSDRLIVAGGGGGHGYLEQGRNGGDGGGLTGGEGDPANDNPAWISGGGTQNAGGFAPTYGDVEPGSFGQGGDGDGDGAGGGGGGGGYYGGGGGQFSGGGGGSSFVDAPGNTNTQTTSGVNTGNGYVIISWAGLTIPECNEGCMNPLACNYDDTAEVDDGSCILPDGCTDPTACNYDDTAQCDDGSCVLPDGCTDDTACNYDPNAICDDGSCAFVIDCAGVCGGTFVGDLCGNCYDPNGVSEPGSQQFDFTGGVQSFTVPENVTEITVEAYGAQGGGNGAAQGGLGGSATATIPVTPLEVLNVYVGGAGTSAFGVIPDGGFNGGGGIYSTSGRAGTGGGASDVRRGTGFSDRLIVAGGGGGHGYLEQGRNGGDGGGLTGGEGDPANDNPAWISGGGTQNAGGFAPTYGDVEPGSFGQGGDGDGDGAGGGGGGGGYYGGGGGQFSGGGGGSSFVDAPGNTNTQTTSGVNTGNGYVIISWAGLTIPECNEGCMNPLACNYDDTAEVDDGSCILPDGCTDPTACNYDDTAQCDDGSCVLPDGCTDDTACNYDPNAICDDGSCAFVIDCAGVCGGTFVGDLCGNCYDPNGVSEPGSQQFDFTGGVQSFTVPENVTEITVEAYGAQGGGNGAAQGGLGGSATATIPVTPLEVLNVYVGGAGTSAFGVIPDGGFNGGGGIYSTSGRAGTGGGASDVRRGTGFSDRLIVAGGGGGHGYLEQGRNGGDGGGLTGGEGDPANDNPAWISGGGTQNAGGFAPTYGDVEPGSFGQGGDGDGDGAGGGGGGGGYYGGGGGQFSGGGGGSSFVDAPGNTNTQTTSGVNTGNGYVIISWEVALVPECNEGCTNSEADNFDPDADADDGSCIFSGCTDETACNFDPQANQDDGSCILPDGCTDESACNYNEFALCDDESCTYANPFEDCSGNCLDDDNGNGVCDELEVYGCTYSDANNYNSAATTDDGSCDFAEISGCTYENALNYNPEATSDDGSCEYAATDIEDCMDPAACNYNANATVDSGNCFFPPAHYDCNFTCLNDTDGDGVCDELEIDGCTDPEALNFVAEATDDDGSCQLTCASDLNGDLLVNSSDLLQFLGTFGQSCP